jgi:transcription elongation factor
MGVDLTKNFFFSYSYSLAHSLQQNHKQAGAAAAAAAAAGSQQPTRSDGGHSSTSEAAAAAAAGFDVYDGSMFVWNAHLTRPLRGSLCSSRWTLPLVHGYWEQRQVSSPTCLHHNCATSVHDVRHTVTCIVSNRFHQSVITLVGNRSWLCCVAVISSSRGSCGALSERGAAAGPCLGSCHCLLPLLLIIFFH